METEPLDDVEVIKKVLAGQQDLYGLILDRYQKPIFNFIYRFFGNYALAEDLTQDTFLRCYQFLKSYDQKRKFSTWLYTVAKNLCIDHLKKRSPGREISLERVLPVVEKKNSSLPQDQNPQRMCIRSQEDARLFEGLGELEPTRRLVLVLYYFQGLTYQEIAETLSVPVSTVKIRIFRAKKALLEKMKGRL